MKKKIKFLIITSILGLIALSSIQAYLINNTYKLNKDTFVDETKRSISRFDNNVIVFDTLYDKMFEFLVLKITDYKLNSLKKSDLLNDFHQLKDSINGLYIEAYKKEFKKRGIAYNLKFQKRLKSLIILDNLENDTLYFEPDNLKMNHFFGEDFNPSNEYISNNSKTQTDYSTDYIDDNGEWQTLSFEFEITTENFINADEWKFIVLRRMTGTLILSILIFILVISLLYYSIKSLITQKKIADVKTDFVNNITHEFKTPLATLSLATKMLEKEEVKVQPQLIKTTVKTINRQSRRLQKLLDQVLDNSLGFNDIRLNKNLLKANEYINNLLDDFLLSIKDQSVELTRDINTDNTIYIDKFYFTTALLNILENAIKYNQNSPKIHCKLSSNSTSFTIEISDNGLGIAEKYKKQIFDKFFRAEQSEIHNVKGLGLGLYYANEIIKAHKGKINIDSKLNTGSTFKITIPLNQ